MLTDVLRRELAPLQEAVKLLNKRRTRVFGGLFLALDRLEGRHLLVELAVDLSDAALRALKDILKY